MRKYIVAQESFYLQGILNNINEQDTSFLDCKHKHLINLESCDVCLHIEFHGFISRINSKGYHNLVPGLISIIFTDGMGPFKLASVIGSWQ